ncbi:MAG: hypothetical protein ACM3VW_08240, partial [Bacteroidota bacterium]
TNLRVDLLFIFVPPLLLEAIEETGAGTVISHAVWLYFRFPLSLRMVEEMLAARGIVVTADQYRAARTRAFNVWAAVTGAAVAA